MQTSYVTLDVCAKYKRNPFSLNTHQFPSFTHFAIRHVRVHAWGRGGGGGEGSDSKKQGFCEDRALPDKINCGEGGQSPVSACSS